MLAVWNGIVQVREDGEETETGPEPPPSIPAHIHHCPYSCGLMTDTKFFLRSMAILSKEKGALGARGRRLLPAPGHHPAGAFTR